MTQSDNADIFYMEGTKIKNVFTTRGTMRCVLFYSGNTGVVNAQEEIVLETGQFGWLKFGSHGFLRAHSDREIFIDMKNDGKIVVPPHL